MSPYLLERLAARLGNPPWFWPAVFALLFALILLGSSVSPTEALHG